MRVCAALLLLGALGGCAYAPRGGPGPAPAPIVERAPPPPPGYYAWRPGHWRWNGYRYVWITGHYVLRPA
nr:hypothetical protein [uncultured Lichenicoccus sp.]